MNAEIAKKLMLRDVAKICIKDYIKHQKREEIQQLFETLKLITSKTIGEC